MFPAARILAAALFAFGLALGPGASAQDDLEDVLGGFEDEVPEEFQVDGAPAADAAPATLPLGFLKRLIKRPLWLAGMGTDIGAVLAQAIAIAFVPLLIASPFFGRPTPMWS